MERLLKYIHIYIHIYIYEHISKVVPHFFLPENDKKDFSKTHQSILMAQILQTISFFDTEKLAD